MRVLYVTDLTYPARGRRYGDEDVLLSAELGRCFTVALCHPLAAAALLPGFDVVLIRNSGPVIHYRDAFERFRAAAAGTPVFNQLTGKADQRGKQYLVDLFVAGFPVVPTVDDPRRLDRLPPADEYAVKPKLGADSVGLRFVGRDQLPASGDDLFQPRIRFEYEVSFYFVDRTFHYALHAPDPRARWELQPYRPTPADLDFAQRFVDWNDIDHGIQRVDACRTIDGGLLLVELEDLNPYLSLDALAPTRRRDFVDAVIASVEQLHQ